MRGKAKPGVDWSLARRLYESGEHTLDQIGAQVGCTRFSVIKRRDREGWDRPTESSPDLVAALPPAALPAPINFKPLGTKDSPDTRAAILRALLDGDTIRDAADVAGISEDTLARWRDLDADFAARMRAATRQWHLNRRNNIQSAGDRGDWKADAWLLERHPATRDQYRTAADPRSAPAFQIVLNVARSGETIDSTSTTEYLTLPHRTGSSG